MVTQHIQFILHFEQCITSFWVSISTHLLRLYLAFPSAESGRWSIIFLTEVKCPHEWPGYCHKHLFSLEVVAVLVLIHRCRALSGVIVDTYQDEDRSNFIFLIGYVMSG